MFVEPNFFFPLLNWNAFNIILWLMVIAFQCYNFPFGFSFYLLKALFFYKIKSISSTFFFSPAFFSHRKHGKCSNYKSYNCCKYWWVIFKNKKQYKSYKSCRLFMFFIIKWCLQSAFGVSHRWQHILRLIGFAILQAWNYTC